MSINQLVNNYYVLDYLALAGVDQPQAADPRNFWSSQEANAPSSEFLEFDMGSVRPINCISFEIIGKPINFEMQYSTDNINWADFVDNVDFNNEQGVTYLGGENPWIYIERHFNTVQAQYVKVIFDRTTDPFPFRDSDSFPFSVDVRNLRLLYLMDDTTDYVDDSGADILGNSFRTQLYEYVAANATDGDTGTYWKSFPNTDPSAVEALYLDLRSGGAPVVIDKVYLDPITYGPSMHFYYSSDDSTSNWDTKLWTPVPRHYILHKGFHNLPSSTTCKYLKIEFSNLVPIPYNVAEYPNFHSFTYRKYPSWVQNYFSGVYNGVNNLGELVSLVDTIDIDALTLAYTTPTDLLSSSALNTSFPEDPGILLQDYVKGVAAQQNLTPQAAQQELESEIAFRNSFQWQNDLSLELNQGKALTRLLLQMQSLNTGFGAEDPAPDILPPSIQSIPDLQESQDQKYGPTMWFPLTCRHTYQIVETTRSEKVAYFVGIREAGAYRNDYTVNDDPDSYVEVFGDAQNVEVNDFIQNDLYWSVDG